MATKLTLEQRAQRYAKWAKLAAFLIFGLVVAPYVGMAIYGIAGVVAAVILMVTVLTFLPWFGRFMSNLRLSALKAEARRSPVATLQNEAMRKQKLLNEMEERVKIFGGQVKTFESKMEGFSARFPEESAQFQKSFDQMQKLYQVQKDKWRLARRELDTFLVEIEKAAAKWDMSQVAAQTAEYAGLSEDDLLAKIISDTSLEAIQGSMNEAFAQLDVSLMVEEERDRANPVSMLLKESAVEAQPVAFRKTINQAA